MAGTAGEIASAPSLRSGGLAMTHIRRPVGALGSDGGLGYDAWPLRGRQLQNNTHRVHSQARLEDTVPPSQ